MGNHLVSNSAAAINAVDDASTADPDESVLNLANGPRRRRNENGGPDALEGDDMESLASMQLDGNKDTQKAEEERDLPPHACA